MFIPSTFKRPVSSWKALNLRKTLLMASSVRLKPLNCSRLPCVYAQETLTFLLTQKKTCVKNYVQKECLTIPLQQLNGLETLVIIMVANKYAFLQITRRRFLNEWEAFKKVISRRNIRRRITIPLTLSNLKLLRRITRTENILHRNFT